MVRVVSGQCEEQQAVIASAELQCGRSHRSSLRAELLALGAGATGGSPVYIVAQSVIPGAVMKVAYRRSRAATEVTVATSVATAASDTSEPSPQTHRLRATPPSHTLPVTDNAPAATSTVVSSPPAKPNFSSARVAVLLLGAPFRSGGSLHGGELSEGQSMAKVACNLASKHAQKEASLALVQQVIVPLEECGAKVEVLYTLPRTCPPRGEVSALLHEWLGSQRIVAERSVSPAAVGEAVRMAYVMLEEHMNTTGTSYDYVFRTRHDMHMERNLLTWPGADFGKILFQPKCVICNGFDSTQKCADDLKEGGSWRRRCASRGARSSRTIRSFGRRSATCAYCCGSCGTTPRTTTTVGARGSATTLTASPNSASPPTLVLRLRPSSSMATTKGASPGGRRRPLGSRQAHVPSSQTRICGLLAAESCSSRTDRDEAALRRSQRGEGR